jgi:DNA ligase-4
MECFQPQLAQFQMHSFQKMVDNMRPTEDDTEFWIEEKLDGERMQMHMMEDSNVPGGKRFGFWSRRAKNYTYLYGSSLEDESGAITRHLKNAFDPGVRNLILDGEMITWDPEADMILPFGTLKTAALSEQRNPFQGTGPRPLFRVFDILYLNDEPLTRYTLRDRRKALQRCLKDVPRRIEIHPYESAHSVEAIEPLLRKVVAEASEGLVLKNPRSVYRLNSRNDDWMKVKPEYMTEFGESLDCIIIGGYYGSGHRGGALSSFLCGLRVDQNHIQKGANPQKCYSFFKVGGGFKMEDYANIRHHTEGKWNDYDPKKPPLEFMELGGGDLQYERPDVWIKPSDSVVVSVKAASVASSDQFRMGFTLRFPRFKRLRMDRDWSTALSIQDFMDLKSRVEEESKQKEFKVDTRRRVTKKPKKELVIAGGENTVKTPYAGPSTKVFEGLNFCILSEALKPIKKSKPELEQFIKANGGAIFQSPTAVADMIVVADKKVVKVASLMKSGSMNVVRPKWVLDAVRQSEVEADEDRFLIPFEPKHMFFIVPDDYSGVHDAVDEYGDSYARDVDAEELKEIFAAMPKQEDDEFDAAEFLEQLEKHGHGFDTADFKGLLFQGLRFYVNDSPASEEDALHLKLLINIIKFRGGSVAEAIEDKSITHIIIASGSPQLAILRSEISKRRKVPRFVTPEWVGDCCREGTVLDEERYASVG